VREPSLINVDAKCNLGPDFRGKRPHVTRKDGVARREFAELGSQISNPRPGCKIRDGGSGSRSIFENKPRPDLVRKSLAEWCRRALGGDLPPRAARPCDCSQRAAPEAAAFRVRLLPSRRPHAPFAGQGIAGVQNSLQATRQQNRSCRSTTAPGAADSSCKYESR